MKKGRSEAENTSLSKIRENMSKDQIRANGILQQPVCNNRLNIIPIEEFNHNLKKQQFLDAVRLAYQLPLPNLLTRCTCDEKLYIQHAMSCKMEDFVALRHNKLRDITGALLEEVCHDVSIEPILQPMSDSNLVPLTTNTNDGAGSDVSKRSFWITG